MSTTLKRCHSQILLVLHSNPVLETEPDSQGKIKHCMYPFQWPTLWAKHHFIANHHKHLFLY